VIHNRDSAIFRPYTIRGVPTSFILDADSQLPFVEVGFTIAVGLRLRMWWAELR